MLLEGARCQPWRSANSLDTTSQFTLHPLQLSAWVAAAAVVISWPTGVLAALWLRNGRGRWHFLLESFFLLPLVLPPVMTGLVLLMLLGRNGPAANLHLLFTPWAAVLAGATVAFPLVFQTARGAFAGVDPHLEDAARSLGAGQARLLRTVTLPLCWPGLAAGAVLAYARALGEFGATVMVAGNVPAKTMTAPVAIYYAATEGHLELAAIYSGVLVLFNLCFLAGLHLPWMSRHRAARGR